jgi:putative phosphoribosyl transferase
MGLSEHGWRRPIPLFEDRADAGRRLAEHLGDYAGRDDVVTIGLPRGGVPVAFEVARALGAPLDVFVVRKLGFPGHEELAIGALASGGVRVMNEELVSHYQLPEEAIARVIEAERQELTRRERELRGDVPPLPLAGRAAVVVDDGLATGVSMRAAIRALRAHEVGELVAAAPVSSRQACALLAGEADAVVCPNVPEPFEAVGAWYADFAQTSDAEVRELLAAARGGGDSTA